MEQALCSGDQPGAEGSHCTALARDARHARRLHSTAAGACGGRTPTPRRMLSGSNWTSPTPTSALVPPTLPFTETPAPSLPPQQGWSAGGGRGMQAQGEPRSQVTAPHAPQPMWRVSMCESVHVGCVYGTRGPQDLRVCPAAPSAVDTCYSILGVLPHCDRACHELPVCFTNTTVSSPPFSALCWESDISVVLPPPARQAPLAASWGPGTGTQEPVRVGSDCSVFLPGVFPFPRGDPAHVRTAAEQPEGVEGPGR